MDNVHLFQSIPFAGQEPVLFDLSIRENILLGNPKATEDNIKEACKQSNALGFIQKLPKGLDTLVGEGGSQLSGGQKQRIAIARALVRSPQILLLDEATSALDTESERVVQQALDRARRGRTTLVVAHRLSTIKSADIIVTIDEGSVKEIGSHIELMANKGHYHTLLETQLESEVSLEHDMGSEVSKKQDEIENNPTDYKIKKKIETEEELPKISMSRLLRKNEPEAVFITVGLFASAGAASLLPLLSIVFGKVLGVLGYEDSRLARSESVFYALLFLLLGCLAALAELLQGWMFGISGENLTMRIRKEAFAAMLAQEIGWFDEQENSAGALCARLSSDASKVQGGTGAKIGSVLRGVFSLIVAIFIGLYYQWKLGLVASIFLPILVAASYLMQQIVNGKDTVEAAAFEASSKVSPNNIWPKYPNLGQILALLNNLAEPR